jgi:hypothetical protein
MMKLDNLLQPKVQELSQQLIIKHQNIGAYLDNPNVSDKDKTDF